MRYDEELDKAGVAAEDRSNSAIVFEKLPWLDEWITEYDASILDAREQNGTHTAGKGHDCEAMAFDRHLPWRLPQVRQRTTIRAGEGNTINSDQSQINHFL